MAFIKCSGGGINFNKFIIFIADDNDFYGRYNQTLLNSIRGNYAFVNLLDNYTTLGRKTIAAKGSGIFTLNQLSKLYYVAYTCKWSSRYKYGYVLYNNDFVAEYTGRNDLSSLSKNNDNSVTITNNHSIDADVVIRMVAGIMI